MASLISSAIEEILLSFNWSDYGLDNVEEVQPDWAEALAERIDFALFGRKETK